MIMFLEDEYSLLQHLVRGIAALYQDGEESDGSSGTFLL